MLKRKLALFLAFALVAGGFAWGLTRLFALRSAAGDALPVYSTLRADPLGAKVLLDALREVPGLQVERQYQPLVYLHPTAPVTLFYLGLGPRALWEKGELAHFESLIVTGSRAVFTFVPGEVKSLEKSKSTPQPDGKKQEEKASEPTEAKEKKEESASGRANGEQRKARLRPRQQDEGVSFSTVAAQWGFSFKMAEETKKAPELPLTATLQPPASGLEASLPWHSPLYFDAVKAPWKTLYVAHGHPVVIERSWGSGSLVLASDTYFLSNEALHEEARPAQLLAALLGTSRTIIFDEEHLGLKESSGLATLARKYRLHGLIAALALLATLFLWQNLVRFVPAQATAPELAEVVSGRSSSEGFLSLLRRSVPPRELLKLAAEEWRRSFSHDSRALERLAVVFPEGAAAPRKEADIVATYQAMARSLRKGPTLDTRKAN